MKIQGYCPMGCGETLMLGSGGYVTCGLLGCSNPTAVSLEVLEQRALMENAIRSDKVRRAIVEQFGSPRETES